MGHTRKRHYDQYSLAYKLNAILLASPQDTLAKDVAETLGIHPIMLYRWCMEYREGTLFAKPIMKNNNEKRSPSEKAELAKANARIKKLEKQLARSQEDVEILKKFEQFLKENP